MEQKDDTSLFNDENTDNATTENHALREEVIGLRAQLRNLEARLATVESWGADKRLSNNRVPQNDDNAASFAAPVPQTKERMEYYQDILQRRQARNRDRTPEGAKGSGRLAQLTRELEGQPLGSARIQIENMKTSGSLNDYLVLPPGATTPNDFNPTRMLITVDQYQMIIKAELG